MPASISAFILLATASLAHGHGATIPDQTCVKDPSLSQCANVDTYYTPSLVKEDLDVLCGSGGSMSMVYMSGCTIKRLCDGNKNIASKYCSEWSLLTNICSSQYGETMMGMHGCKNYVAICKSGTAAVKCSDAAFKGIPDLVPTNKALMSANSVCTGNSADACKTCTSNMAPDCTDPLTTLSSVCKGMITDSKCAEWKKMCNSNSNDLDELCKTKSNTSSSLRASVVAALVVAFAALAMA